MAGMAGDGKRMDRPTIPGKPATEPEDGAGLECTRCGCRHFLVVYTRPGDKCIKRVRSCRHCGRRVVTRERM